LGNIHYSRMQPGQEPAIVNLIHWQISDYGTSFKAIVTAEALQDSDDFLNIEVAESDGEVVGLCAWTLSFSTWRGIKGMYIADLYVIARENKNRIARNLLALAAKNGAAKGARFIRTEVDVTDEFAEALFSEAGFWNQTRHSTYFCEPDKFTKLADTMTE
jgi:predicted N-acetyltransferase YhbS